MLVLIAHGSRNQEWRRSLEDLKEALQGTGSGPEIRLAFMQFSGPTLEDVVQEGRRQGTEDFRILPLFMASAGHVDKDIRPLVGSLAQRYPDLHFHILTPVGEDPRFHRLIQTIAQDSLAQDSLKGDER